MGVWLLVGTNPLQGLYILYTGHKHVQDILINVDRTDVISNEGGTL